MFALFGIFLRVLFFPIQLLLGLLRFMFPLLMLAAVALGAYYFYYGKLPFKIPSNWREELPF